MSLAPAAGLLMLTTSVTAPGIAPLVILRLFTQFFDTELKLNEVLGQTDFVTDENSFQVIDTDVLLRIIL